MFQKLLMYPFLKVQFQVILSVHPDLHIVFLVYPVQLFYRRFGRS